MFGCRILQYPRFYLAPTNSVGLLTLCTIFLVGSVFAACSLTAHSNPAFVCSLVSCKLNRCLSTKCFQYSVDSRYCYLCQTVFSTSFQSFQLPPLPHFNRSSTFDTRLSSNYQTLINFSGWQRHHGLPFFKVEHCRTLSLQYLSRCMIITDIQIQIQRSSSSR